MKITILLKSAPLTDEANRALRTVSDMLAQGHSVSLFLLQEAVRFCASPVKRSDSMDLKPLIENNLKVHVLAQDASMRGIELFPSAQPISAGSYESLVELLDSSEQVIGLL
jgi:sulfur relay (sulfurtransferase) complex TusBCD TusD component (DsrE family)